MFKKMLSVALASVMCMGLSVSAFAGMDLGTKVDPEIYDPENELRIQEKLASAALIRSTDNYYYTSVTVDKQITGYYCGPAASYTVLRSWDVSVPSSTATLPFFGGCPNACPFPGVDHVCEKTYTSPQITLADNMRTNTGGTDLGQMKMEINDRLPNNYYSDECISSESTLASRLSITLNVDHPLIAWVDAKDLKRYKGTSFSGHYITLYSYNTSNGKVGISDPNYYGNYGGKYTEELDVLFNAMNRGGADNLLW